MNKLFSINVHGHVLLLCSYHHNFLNQFGPVSLVYFVSVLPAKFLIPTFVFSSFTGPSKRMMMMMRMPLLECDSLFRRKSARLICSIKADEGHRIKSQTHTKHNTTSGNKQTNKVDYRELFFVKSFKIDFIVADRLANRSAIKQWRMRRGRQRVQRT